MAEQRRLAESADAIEERRLQVAGVSNGEINRELTALKRIFVLAIQAGKLLHRPHIPMLRENNVRTGFLSASSSRACACTCRNRFGPL